MSTQPTIFIVDDDESIRDSLHALLSARDMTVHSFASGEAFFEVFKPTPKGCVLVDVRLPAMGGLEIQRRITAEHGRYPVIVMTGFGDVAMAVDAMKAGALDFIEKPFEQGALTGSIERAIAEGERAWEEDNSANEIRERIASLTPREREVLDLLVEGLPNKGIAYELGISPRTVEIHRARTMDKMQARSLSRLVRMVLTAGHESAAS